MKFLPQVLSISVLRSPAFSRFLFYIVASLIALIGAGGLVSADTVTGGYSKIRNYDFRTGQEVFSIISGVPAEASFVAPPNGNSGGDITFARDNAVVVTSADKVPFLSSLAYATISASGSIGILSAEGNISASLSDTMTISAAGLDGSVGTFDYIITPTFDLNKSYPTEAYSGFNVSHDVYGLDGAAVLAANQSLFLTYHFVFGQPFHIGLLAEDTVSASYTGGNMFPPGFVLGDPLVTASINSETTLAWNGITHVFDSQGNLLQFAKGPGTSHSQSTAVSLNTAIAYILSASGYDYTVPGVQVPEADSLALLTIGSVTLLAGRKKKNAK